MTYVLVFPFLFYKSKTKYIPGLHLIYGVQEDMFHLFFWGGISPYFLYCLSPVLST